ncbi:hypothetical protein [Paracidobacterium acidisoli]|uniref:Uncharacterized protein n=1 Tax=Paracidobacterium acidisoli TaxID=2303751 RepID=A0A372IUA0_9BACT|nr:hypothetical protein [Paracidobacterium acidisoli]MBT9329967.1 hypothetical protein [Paracidobacterium acidisoli]
MSIVALGVFVALVVAGFLYTQIASQKLRSATWDGLAARIVPVPFSGISIVAMDNLQPGQNQIELEPGDMWQLVGGKQGLDSMYKNAEVLIQLAAWVQRWNYEEAAIVSERIRRDAVQLRRSIRRIRFSMLLQRKPIRIPFYIHEAATAYHLMSQRLLALYQGSHSGLYPRLAESLNYA